MRKTITILLSLMALILLSACTDSEVQTIKIAVMGDPDTFYPGFQEGVNWAVNDLNAEYADSGYRVECVFAGGSSYEESAALIDALSEDRSITAMIGAVEMDVNQTAAEICERNQKLLVIPYLLNDSLYSDNHYKLVLSMANSGSHIGQTLRVAARESGKTRWVLCADNREFELAEIRSFLQAGREDGISVVDCVNITTLQNHFDETYVRWETLGVEGVIMCPQNTEGFEILKDLKKRNPDLICGGDSAFDDSSRISSDAELAKAMIGFILVPEFITEPENTPQTQQNRTLEELATEYYEQTGNHLDTWFFQGYNAIRMIADTAAQNQTTDPVEIARLLHRDGYCGLMSTLKFSDSGEQIADAYYYVVFDGEGWDERSAQIVR